MASIVCPVYAANPSGNSAKAAAVKRVSAVAAMNSRRSSCCERSEVATWVSTGRIEEPKRDDVRNAIETRTSDGIR